MKKEETKSVSLLLEKVHPLHRDWVEELLQKGVSEKEVLKILDELEKEM